MDGPNRIIIYNQSFMSKIANNTGTDWAGISILAHEIGHHLMQHTLGVGGGRSDQELAADQITSRIIKGRPFGVGFECLAQPLRKGHPL